MSVYSDEMIEFLKRNSIYKEYNPKDYIKKIEGKKELGYLDESLRTLASIKPNDKRTKQYKKLQFAQDISFGVVVCIKNTNEDFLRQMIESVLNQTYEKFTLYIIDRSDKGHAYIANVCTDYEDGRIVYRKLPQGQEVCWDYFVCDYIVLINEIDALSMYALSEVAKAIEEQNADMIYSDSGVFKRKKNNISHSVLRPDYAPVNLETYNYIGDFCVVKRLNLDLTKNLNIDNTTNAAYSFIKEQAEYAKNIVHIRKPLYFENYKKQISTKVSKREYRSEGNPLVSIIIKSINDIRVLSRLINSIFMLTTYPNYEIVIVESDENKADNLIYKYYKLLATMKNVRFLRWKGDESKAQIYNYAATKIRGEYLVFIDEYAGIMEYDWIEELLVYCVDEKNALVSPKVMKNGKEIVYAGAVYGYFGRSMVKNEVLKSKDFSRNVSVASKHCCMISKSKFIELGAFDEEYATEVFVEDLSLKAVENGYYNVYTPYSGVSLEGYKSKSKGEDYKYFKEKWRNILSYDKFREKY